MSESPPVKRCKRYSASPDVTVEVDGEIFHLHSQLLMLASPVFSSMLEEGRWSEGRTGNICLPGKSKEEFRQVMPFLNTMGASSDLLQNLCQDEVVRLLRWSKEYDIQSLFKACEDFILEQDMTGIEAFSIAAEFGLARRLHQCTRPLCKNPSAHLQLIPQLLHLSPVVEIVLPAMFRHAGMTTPTLR